jgi:insulysin
LIELGNWDTLEVKAKEKGLDTRLELLKFYDSHYSANLMHLVVYGKGFHRAILPFFLHCITSYSHLKSFPLLMFVAIAENLDSLQNLVENKFSDIRNVGRKPFSFPGRPCTSEHLQVYSLLKTSW